jgi:ribosomal protein S18 acetylase RimI-like enzyme
MGAAETKNRLVRIEEVTLDYAPTLLAQARELLLEYGHFVAAQPGVARFCFGTLQEESQRLPQSYLEQGGGCLVARVNEGPAGFVAWRAVPETVARDAWELKRLWVRNQGRGLGLGRALTQAVLDRASAAGRTAVYLDTVPAAMAAAHRLYLDMGFQPCAAYNDNPVEGLAYLVKYL